jgi:Ran GTPase-activating protein (RanGAP) involved in mRNA processing and transport
MHRVISFFTGMGDARMLPIPHPPKENYTDLVLDERADHLALALALKDLREGSAEKLVLHSTKIGNNGAVAVASAMRKSKNLWMLSLCDNDIGDEGAAVIAIAMTEMKSLMVLNLGNNHITDAGAKYIAAAAEECDSLVQLDLSRNRIGNEGAAALATALRRSRKMTTMSLNRNRIGDSGSKLLVAAAEAKTPKLFYRNGSIHSAFEEADYQRAYVQICYDRAHNIERGWDPRFSY